PGDGCFSGASPSVGVRHNPASRPAVSSRSTAFEGLAGLEWGRELIAGSAAGLWRIPTDGDAPEKLPSPGNRSGAFSLHPDGVRIALTAGDLKSEVWVMRLQ